MVPAASPATPHTARTAQNGVGRATTTKRGAPARAKDTANVHRRGRWSPRAATSALPPTAPAPMTATTIPSRLAFP